MLNPYTLSHPLEGRGGEGRGGRGEGEWRGGRGEGRGGREEKYNTMKNTKVQTLGELRMRGGRGWAGLGVLLAVSR